MITPIRRGQGALGAALRSASGPGTTCVWRSPTRALRKTPSPPRTSGPPWPRISMTAQHRLPPRLPPLPLSPFPLTLSTSGAEIRPARRSMEVAGDVGAWRRTRAGSNLPVAGSAERCARNPMNLANPRMRWSATRTRRMEVGAAARALGRRQRGSLDAVARPGARPAATGARIGRRG